jgi:hypothetical protein
LAETAAQAIIMRRDTHIDSLLERLKEERVKRIIQPILIGEGAGIDRLDDDFQYVRDLGLIRSEQGVLRPANPLYAEVIARTLNYNVQENIAPLMINRWFDGPTIRMNELLDAFQAFWRENSEAWINRFQYREAAPHLILQAFLQRVLNGGAKLHREFATGTRRVDLCVEYGANRYPLELKLLRNDKTLDEGLAQLADYMDKMACTEGWLILFDQSQKSWDEKIYRRTETRDHRTIHVVGC